METVTEDLPGQSYPRAQLALYKTAAPNSRVELYDGPGTLHLEGREVPLTECRFAARWLPTPALVFDAIAEEMVFADLPLVQPEVSIELPDHKRLVVVVQRFNPPLFEKGPTDLGGVVQHPRKLFSIEGMDEMLFHLSNFLEYLGDIATARDGNLASRGRLAFRGGKWSVVIDQIVPTHEAVKELKTDGGYYLTHVGALRRTDGEVFSGSEADFMRKALYFFLSFLRGCRCGPTLSVARGNSCTLEEIWEMSSLASWRGERSWFPTRVPLVNEDLDQAFDGFVEKWSSGVWREPLKSCISW